VFNGVTDWVYEEEVFRGTGAFWANQKDRFGEELVAYLSFDETDVKNYTFPVYNPSGWSSKEFGAYTNFVSSPPSQRLSPSYT
jgi:dipeptidyl aminopeptidase